jgi:hypothetical protein
VKAFICDAILGIAPGRSRTRDPRGHPARIGGCAAPRDVDIAGILIDANAEGLKKIGRLLQFLGDASVTSRPVVCILSVRLFQPSF